MVIIGASQALDPGSIPGRRKSGALAQSEECVLCKHEVRGSKPRCSILFLFVVRVPANNFIVGNFPAASGLDGRAVQGARLKFESLLEAWVRIPLQALQLLFVSFYKKLQ